MMIFKICMMNMDLLKNGLFPIDMYDEYGSIEKWTVSNITDMSNMFYNYYNFNQDISK